MAATRRRVISSVAALVLVVGFAACSSSAKPISEQNCQELAATFAAVSTTSTTTFDPDALNRTLEEGSALVKRVRELGGCPNEPTLPK
jgi:cytochrome c553